MAIDSRQQQPQMAGQLYDHLRYSNGPQFTNPWGTSAPVSSAYAAVAPPSMDNSQIQRQNMTLPPYQQVPITSTGLPGASSLQTAYAHQSSLNNQHDLLNQQRSYAQYQSAPATTAYQPSSAAGYAAMDMQKHNNGGFAYPQEPARRNPHPFNGATQAQRNSFSDAVDASRAIIGLNQSDITPTPRNMYGDQAQRSASPDSYGFPAQHSAHSSISSASGFHSNYGSSVSDYPLTDYSSASESVDLNHHRTLPPPSTLGNSVPPAPQSMMGQFSSKVSSSSQKKHKCKVCDKRFTRPSSLQTHMYSHTGEKPFACDVEGCGRHFSVVSNLRRHKKVHKGDNESVTTNEDEE